MYGVALLLTVAAVGVEYGWQPGEDGQLEYIIQIEPELVKTLSEGKVDLLSEIPEELQGVKRFRIRVGTGEVPRIGLDPAATASALKPGDSPANKQPNLNPAPFQSAGDPRAPAPTRPTDPRGSPTQSAQPGKVLTPPGRAIQDNDPTLTGGDRYTDSGNSSAFPAIGTRPGIGRTPTQPTDRFGKGDGASLANDMDPIGNSRGTASTTPVWDSKTNQWRTPNATAPGNNQNTAPSNQDDPRYQLNDPRYATDDRTGQTPGVPEVRRDNVTDPRDPRYAPPPSAYGQYQPPPAGNQWGAPPPNYVQPLQDPDRGYYGPYAQQPPPGYYNPNLPMNRQVGYQVAANPPAPAANTTGTAPAASSNNENSSASSATSTTATKTSSTKSTRGSSGDEEALKPWWPLTFTAMLLFASIGLNFYLGWIAHGVYQRYRALLMEVRNVRAATI